MSQIAKSYPKMSVVLASNSVKELCTSLSLTDQQINRAKSTALALSSNPNLRACDPFSLVKYCFETARYNFTRDDCIYPVPYGGKVQAQVSYKGFRELAYQSGLYSTISASEVYSVDKVTRDRETGEIKVDFSEDASAIDGSPVGYFAFAKDKEGKMVASVYMSRKEVEKHRDRYSKAQANGPWQTSFDQMAKKTVIKRLCGQLQTTPQLEMAMKQDQIVYGKQGEKDAYLDNPLNDLLKEREGVKAPEIPEEATKSDEDGVVEQIPEEDENAPF